MARANYRLTPEQKADARAALLILDGTGISLEEAARKAVSGKRGLRRVTFEQAVDAFVRSRILDGRRRATVTWYEERLRPLTDILGEKQIDTIGRAELIDTLADLLPTKPARAATSRACRALWRWAVAEEPPLVGADVTIGLKTSSPSRGGGAPVVLSVEQCEAMLAAAGNYRSALALMLFAGVRPDEVCGPEKLWLRWEHINTAEQLVRVPAEIAKTGRARVIENLPPALWRWLEPGPLRDDIAPARSREVVRRAARAAGFGPRKPWPQDCLRHTFASYALALTRNPGQVALWLGHEGNPRMLHNHYRGVATTAHEPVTQTMAERFFALADARWRAAAADLLRLIARRPQAITLLPVDRANKPRRRRA